MRTGYARGRHSANSGAVSRTLPTLWLAILVLLGALALSACGKDKSVREEALDRGLLGPPPTLTGIQVSIAESTITDDGWMMCYSDTYDRMGTPLGTILNQCPGRYLMLGCLPTGGATLTVAAGDARQDVTFDTGNGDTTGFHPGNGISWYYADNWSWGFFEPSDGINKNACDFNSTPNNFPRSRLCWHTGTAGGASAGQIGQGYLCGSNTNLFTSAWERRIYRHL